ncbi:MAG: ATPase [Tannerella sp.]|jgi:N-acetylglucosamine kinase-like BadF-type ATPase|nr:ATPase [Tannerella sp.]
MMDTNLIVDSGTTRTDWLVVRGSTVIGSACTKGLNPYFQSYEDIQKEIENVLFHEMKTFSVNNDSIDRVYFYGAGCVFDKVEIMRGAISSCMPACEINVYSDLLAAAHSTCGHEAGIACILGTGSNSCFYDGNKIVKNIPPLGYILGDEGGGVMLGRILVGDVLKEILSKPLRDLFFERFHITQADILDHVYKKPFPNRFLAGFSPFLYEHVNEPEIRLILVNAFKSFITRNVMQYDYKEYAVNFAGSIAYQYKEILEETVESAGIRIGKVIKSPMKGLIDYYNVWRLER